MLQRAYEIKWCIPKGFDLGEIVSDDEENDMVPSSDCELRITFSGAAVDSFESMIETESSSENEFLISRISCGICLMRISNPDEVGI